MVDIEAGVTLKGYRIVIRTMPEAMVRAAKEAMRRRYEKHIIYNSDKDQIRGSD